MSKPYYTIGQLAQLTDMSTKALRFYEEKGLITSVRSEKSNYRLLMKLSSYSFKEYKH